MEGENDSHVRNLFLSGSYIACTNAADASGLSPLALTYIARAHLAKEPPEIDAARTVLNKTSSSPLVEAIRLLTSVVESKPTDATDVVTKATELANQAEDASAVVGTILYLVGSTQEALNVLSKQSNTDPECVAVHVSILLSMNRLDLAKELYTEAQSWGGDAISIQLCEAWIALVEGGGRYKSAYYAFDEITSLPGCLNSGLLVGKALSSAALGQLEKAEEDLSEAYRLEGNRSSALANMAIISTIEGKGNSTSYDELKKHYPEHKLVSDLSEQEKSFDEAAATFQPLVAA